MLTTAHIRLLLEITAIGVGGCLGIIVSTFVCLKLGLY